MIVLNPIEPAPELSMRSGGLPPKRPKQLRICVDGVTLGVTVGWFFLTMSAAKVRSRSRSRR